MAAWKLLMKERFCNRWKTIVASLSILVSALCFSVMTTVINLANRTGIPVTQLIVIRLLTNGVFCATWLKIRGHALLGLKKTRKWVFIRGVVQGIAVVCAWNSVVLLNNGDAVALISTFPIMSTVGA